MAGTIATFEVATLADAVSKASRFSPTKGSALDRSAGVVLELKPTDNTVVVRSTDLTTTYRQVVTAVSIKGDEDIWRLNVQKLNDIMSKLEMGVGARITFQISDDGSFVKLKSGKTTGKLMLFDRSAAFPEWTPFETDGLTVIEDPSYRISQVAWACDKPGSALGGIRVTGTHLIAFNQKNVAMVPFACPIEEPVTVPLHLVAPVLRNCPEIGVRATSDAFEVLPDPDTQITVRLLLGPYPDVSRVMKLPLTNSLVLERAQVLSVVERVLSILGNDRYPKMHMTLTGDSVKFRVEDDDYGVLQDELTVPTHAPFEFTIGPNDLQAMLEAAREPKVTFSYGDKPTLPYRIDAGDFLAAGAPRA
jgi:DNA polymerase III sliding clamp (beta) subunit (PCNA family)